MANLISTENSGFESGLLSSSWVAVSLGTISDSTEQAHNGTHSMKLDDLGSTGDDFNIASNFDSNTPLTPSIQYEFYVWMLPSIGATPGFLMLSVSYWDSLNDPISAAFSPVMPEQEVWTKYSFLFTPPSGTASGTFNLFGSTNDSFGAGPPFYDPDEARYFDDIYVDVYTLPTVTPSATPPSLRQRQNPLRVP